MCFHRGKARYINSMVLMIVCTLAVTANAVVILPGATVAIFGTTAAARPEIAGGLAYSQLRDFEIRSAEGALLFQGKLRSEVRYSNLGGNKVFYHRIEQTNSNLDGKVSHLTTWRYDGFDTDADFRTDVGVAADVGLSSVSRAAAPGWWVRATFDGGIAAGARSRYLFILTNAFAYRVDGGFTRIYLTTGESAMIVTPCPI